MQAYQFEGFRSQEEDEKKYKPFKDRIEKLPYPWQVFWKIKFQELQEEKLALEERFNQLQNKFAQVQHLHPYHLTIKAELDDLAEQITEADWVLQDFVKHPCSVITSMGLPVIE